MTSLISKQILDIKKQGFKILPKKIKIFFKNLLNLEFISNRFFFFIPALLVILVLIIIRPIILVRLGVLHRRIGHFVLNTELYLLENKNNINTPKSKYIDLWVLPKQIPNKFMEKILRRNLQLINVYPKIVSEVKNIFKFFYGSSAFIIGDNTQQDRDVNNLLYKSKTILTLNDNEISEGQAILTKYGINKDDKIVCIMNRDDHYLKLKYPEHPFLVSQGFRNSNINNYIKAAEFLAEKGFYVFRMGSVVKDPIISKNKRIIDYGTNGMRTDFLDIYLAFRCEFCVVTSTGWDSLPNLFRKPIVYVNQAPLGLLHTYNPDFIHIIKHHKIKNKKNYLTFKEIENHGVMFGLENSDYADRNIELVENSEAEIFDAVEEMYFKLYKPDYYKSHITLNQSSIWKKFPIYAIHKYNNKKFHGKILSKFPDKFLKNNTYLFD